MPQKSGLAEQILGPIDQGIAKLFTDDAPVANDSTADVPARAPSASHKSTPDAPSTGLTFTRR